MTLEALDARGGETLICLVPAQAEAIAALARRSPTASARDKQSTHRFQLPGQLVSGASSHLLVGNFPWSY